MYKKLWRKLKLEQHIKNFINNLTDNLTQNNIRIIFKDAWPKIRLKLIAAEFSEENCKKIELLTMRKLVKSRATKRGRLWVRHLIIDRLLEALNDIYHKERIILSPDQINLLTSELTLLVDPPKIPQGKK